MFSNKNSNKTGLSKKGKGQNKSKSAPFSDVLNIRKLPTRVVGIPEELLTKYEIACVVTGMSQLTWTVREKSSVPGRLGKEVPLEDILRLSRAPGFVAANEKQETKDQLLIQAKSFFLRVTEADVRAKDPKLLVETLRIHAENYEKNASMAKAYICTDNEDKKFLEFYLEMLGRVKPVLKKMYEHKLTNKDFDEREEFAKAGVPNSMKGKLYSNVINVQSNSKLWTTLLGKNMEKFCNLTTYEIRTMPAGKLKIFGIPNEIVALLKDDNKVAKMLGEKDLASVPGKSLEEFLKKLVPQANLLTKLQTFQRTAHTKETVRLPDTEHVKYPALEALIETHLKDSYFVPPESVAEVPNFWKETVSPETVLSDPLTNGGVSYRDQAIQKLKAKEILPEDTDVPEEKRNGVHPVMSVFGHVVKDAMVYVVSYTNSKGETVINPSLDDYKPRQLESKTDVPKKKRMQQQVRKNSELSKKSLGWMERLREVGISLEVRKTIKVYLEEFVERPLQEMAARKVFMTCQLTVETAASRYLGIDPGMESEDSPDQGTDPVEEEETDENFNVNPDSEEKKDSALA